MENSGGGEGGLAILEFGGQGGDKHFGISEGKGGLKYSCRPWYGMDIFWNHPFWTFISYLWILVIYHCLMCPVSYHENVRRQSALVRVSVQF